MENAIQIVAGVFGGGLLTALVFVFGYSNKITSIDTQQKAIKDKVDGIYNDLHNGFTCTKHAEMKETLGRIEGFIQHIQGDK